MSESTRRIQSDPLTKIAILRGDDNPYVLVTNIHGESTNFDQPSEAVEAADEEATDRLMPKLPEDSMVVRRKSDGVYGVMVETYELPHDMSDAGDQNDPALEIDTEANVVAVLVGFAENVKVAYPDLDVWVQTGAQVFASRASLRAFVPEGSPLLEETMQIAEIMERGGQQVPTP